MTANRFPTLPWSSIDTVMFDMDGTLLDLHFDNYFWQQHVPAAYGHKYGLSEEEAFATLSQTSDSVLGTIDWYCLDFWANKLDLDIVELKKGVAHKIAIRPHVINLLENLREHGKRILLITNAHPESLKLKMHHTGIDRHFDRLISSHSLKLAKENAGFWQKLQKMEHFEPSRTLLVDDSLPVLRRAQQEGIGHLLAIHQPDSQRGPVEHDEFHRLQDFRHMFCSAESLSQPTPAEDQKEGTHGPD